MSLRSRLIDRLQDRGVGDSGMDLASLGPEDRRAYVLRRLETSVLPRKLTLSGQGVDIRFSASRGLINSAHCEVKGTPARDVSFASGEPDPGELKDLDRALRLASGPEMSFEVRTEALDEAPGSGGVKPSALDALPPEEAPAPAEDAPAVEEKPAAPAKKTRAKSKAKAKPKAKTKAKPKTTARAGKKKSQPSLRPFAFLDTCRQLAGDPGYFTSEGPEAYANRRDKDRFSPRDQFGGLDAWHKTVSATLGDDLVLVVFPTDARADAIACAVNGKHGVDFDFTRTNFARICSAVNETERDE